jgi:hypothetical protein
MVVQVIAQNRQQAEQVKRDNPSANVFYPQDGSLRPSGSSTFIKKKDRINNPTTKKTTIRC